jgi:peptide/nickel transport system permease protein
MRLWPPLVYLARTLAVFAVTLVGLAFVTFVIGRLLPTDPVIGAVGDRASAELYERTRVEMGLDRPVVEQFASYLGNLARGDLGPSFMTGRPVAEDVAIFFPATLELSTVAMLIGVLLGVPLGVVAAARSGRLVDHLVRVVALVGYSVPVFWLGLVALLLFYMKLDWVAGPGRLDVAYEYTVPRVTGFVLVDTALSGEAGAFRDALAHIVLPASVLGFYSMAYITRMTRAFMLAELSQEYITAVRAKGASEARVLWRHAFANIAVPLVTVIALAYAHLLEGAVLTETVFAWPGIGLYVTQGLFSADLNAVLGGTLVVGIAVLVVNTAADALHHVLDPRTRRRWT